MDPSVSGVLVRNQVDLLVLLTVVSGRNVSGSAPIFAVLLLILNALTP